jgi:predicted ATP-grasp superfamily ATP-dependent carboligase
VNKRLQYETARQIGISIPETYYPESIADVRQLSSNIPYPCILKPCQSDPARKQMSGKKVVVVHSAAELISAYQRFANSNIPFMLQEIIPGDDSALFGYLGFWDDEKRERAWLTKRKLRQYPQQFGDGSVQMTVEAPEVAELSARLLRAFNYRGFVCVEFKWDVRTQVFRLIECNPRTASGNQLAISAGVDFPWLGYRYLLGDDLEGEGGRARPGVKYFNEEWDVQAYFALRKSGELGFYDWLNSIRGAEAWAVGARDDPLPLLMGVWRFMLTVPHTVTKILSAPFNRQRRIR